MALRRFWLVVPVPGTEDRNNVEVILGRERNRDHNETRSPQIYYSEADALFACERLATMNPLKPYSVMGIVAIRETAVPTVISKQFTNDGELIIV